jgi:hypothetical protein
VRFLLRIIIFVTQFFKFRIFALILIFAFSASVLADENSTSSDDYKKSFLQSEKAARIWNPENMLTTIGAALSTIALILIFIFLLYMVSRRESNLRLWV